MQVHYGDDRVYAPTAERPFPFTVRELARLECLRSRLSETAAAQRFGRDFFRSTMGQGAGLLPTSEPGLDFPRVQLSAEAAGMLGRLDNHPVVSPCYGCRKEQRMGQHVGGWLHAAGCPRGAAHE